MKNNEFEFDPISTDEEFDVFIGYLKELSEQDRVQVMNPVKFKEFKDACLHITQIVKSENPDAKITYELNEAGAGEGSITIISDEIIVRNVKEFLSGMNCASNFEIYPMKNNLINMSVMFYGLLKEVK